MKRICVVLILSISFVFSFFVYVLPSAFASCVGPLTLSQYKEQADIIALGRVINIDTITTFSVERYFKGHGPSQVNITGQESKGAVTSIDYSFEKNNKYLLFLQKSSSDVLKTNACMGNKEIQDTLEDEDIAVLSAGYPPNGTVDKLDSNFNGNLTVIVGGLLLAAALVYLWRKRNTKC